MSREADQLLQEPSKTLAEHVTLPPERILHAIHVIRGHKVILDADLADLYDLQTKVLNQAVKRNIERFPKDFMFQLSRDQFEILKSQSVTSSWGGRRTPTKDEAVRWGAQQAITREVEAPERNAPSRTCFDAVMQDPHLPREGVTAASATRLILIQVTGNWGEQQMSQTNHHNPRKKTQRQYACVQ